MVSAQSQVEIPTNPPIQIRRPDQVLINKKRPCHIVDLVVSANHKVKAKEREKK